MQQPIVVIGGGFGGIYTIKHLLKKGYQVILISQSQHFTFTPLLHEVATGSLIGYDVAFEYESFFRSARFEFVSGTVTRIEPEQKCVWVGDVSISYQALVIATGSRTNEHMIKGLEFAHGLKTVEDAQSLKRAIVEKAQRAEKSVSVTVVGGGATGCELAFEIQEFLRVLQKRHPTLVSSIRLIHSKSDIGGATRSDMQAYINQRVKQSGIEVVCDTFVKEITLQSVVTELKTFASDVTVAVTGVRPNTDLFIGSLPLDSNGHVWVKPTLQVQGLSEVFALGDIIRIGDHLIPKLAQTAVQEAKVVAENIDHVLKGEVCINYQMKLRGYLLSLGFGDGVGEMHGVFVKGFFAWYIWRTVFLFKTPGLITKLRVAFSWTLGLFRGRNLTSL